MLKQVFREWNGISVFILHSGIQNWRRSQKTGNKTDYESSNFVSVWEYTLFLFFIFYTFTSMFTFTSICVCVRGHFYFAVFEYFSEHIVSCRAMAHFVHTVHSATEIRIISIILVKPDRHYFRHRKGGRGRVDVDIQCFLPMCLHIYLGWGQSTYLFIKCRTQVYEPWDCHCSEFPFLYYCTEHTMDWDIRSSIPVESMLLSWPHV